MKITKNTEIRLNSKKIKDLLPIQSNLRIIANILETSTINEVRLNHYLREFMDFLIADETGSIILRLWDDQIDETKELWNDIEKWFRPQIIEINRAYVSKSKEGIILKLSPNGFLDVIHDLDHHLISGAKKYPFFSYGIDFSDHWSWLVFR